MSEDDAFATVILMRKSALLFCSVGLSLLSIVLIACDTRTAQGTSNDNISSSEEDVLKTKPKQYLYAKIPWGSNKNSVKSLMAKQNFKFIKQDEEGDLIFSGKIAQEDTTTYAQFDKIGKFVRLQHIVEPPENRFFQKYEIIFENLTEKYGNPFKDETSVDDPYKKGDGYETQAIRLGKATYNSEWWTNYVDDPDTGGKSSYPGITLFVKDKLLIYITYYSTNWNKEYNRRYKKGTEGL